MCFDARIQHSLQAARQSRIIPSRDLGVVIDKVEFTRVGHPHFPATWQRAQGLEPLLLFDCEGSRKLLRC